MKYVRCLIIKGGISESNIKSAIEGNKMKFFHKTWTTIKYSLEVDGKKKKGKIKAHIPPMNKLGGFLSMSFIDMSIDELSYLQKMMKFSTMFPLEKNEYVDYQQMLRCGLISKSGSLSPLENHDVKSLFYNTVKGSVLQVNMSEEGYYSFRDMVLDEFEEFDSEIDDMFKDTYQKKVKELSYIKRFRLLFTRKKIKDLKEKLRKETWMMLITKANSHSNEIAQKDFPRRALELLDNFDPEKYKNLISDVTKELDLRSSSVYKEVIDSLNDKDIQNNKDATLRWIIDNTCSTESAFENMKREADYLNKEILYKYCLYYYHNHRKEMNREERRLFQLCFFRREAFQYRIPAFDDFFKSFWENNLQLIFSGLILKGVNPDYKKDNMLLEQKWVEFLSLYPEALDNRGLYNLLKDKQKTKDIINKNFSGAELQILYAFADGHEIDTIVAEFGCTKKYCLELIERYKRDVKLKEEIYSTAQ